MDYYKTVLDSLHRLLLETGVDFWANWIAEDIELWENDQSVSHHLNAYGGMGSFSDVYICVDNKHNITEKQEPWVNRLFEHLSGFSHLLAEAASKNKTINIEYYLTKTPPAARVIEGARCLSCGFSLLTKRNVDNYISPGIVWNEIVGGLKNNQLEQHVMKCLHLDMPIIEVERTQTKKIIDESRISYSDDDGFMRPCRKCKSNNTVVYRWDKSFKKNTQLFVPSDNNLPISW